MLSVAAVWYGLLDSRGNRYRRTEIQDGLVVQMEYARSTHSNLCLYFLALIAYQTHTTTNARDAKSCYSSLSLVSVFWKPDMRNMFFMGV